ncbi:MAG: hypothetical protein QNJ13_15375 [Paracoccaceae bacterium]|nr:hypothetical protein [Paracoccaceae bacterium]
MHDDWVVLRLPPDLLISLRALAQEAETTPGQYLRNYVARKAGTERRPDPVPRPAARNTAALRELVQDLLFCAADWAGLQRALVAEGFALRVKGYGLMVHAWPSDDEICKSGALGFSYAELIKRLGPGGPPDPQRLMAPAPPALRPVPVPA